MRRLEDVVFRKRIPNLIGGLLFQVASYAVPSKIWSLLFQIVSVLLFLHADLVVKRFALVLQEKIKLRDSFHIVVVDHKGNIKSKY